MCASALKNSHINMYVYMLVFMYVIYYNVRLFPWEIYWWTVVTMTRSVTKGRLVCNIAMFRQLLIDSEYLFICNVYVKCAIKLPWFRTIVKTVGCRCIFYKLRLSSLAIHHICPPPLMLSLPCLCLQCYLLPDFDCWKMIHANFTFRWPQIVNYLYTYSWS